MRCPRCDGLMVQILFQDYWEDNDKLHFKGFRCVICGEVIDQEILINRAVLEPEKTQ